MAWKNLLLAFVVAVLWSCTMVSAASAATNICSVLDINSGTCPTVTGTNSGDTTTLNGSQAGATPGQGTGVGGGPGQINPCIIPGNSCRITIAGPPASIGGVTGARAITLSDLATFQPSAGVQRMEPNGWSVVGLNANFYSTAAQHIESGTLLGRPASVRFTPIGWQWNYGDGTIATTPTAGASWSSLRLGEFQQTQTSHVFERAGTFSVTVSVQFTAEYQFAGGKWIAVAGSLLVPSNQLTAIVGDASTVFVQRECTAIRSDPGC